ncbi:MAG: conjugal transfer protein TraF [Pseudohongiella sp.]|uniref:conjugal transfer protein TraF n=1 Tax=Pseudohongiella sp. TaxID=1979412 RepID=UPI0034A072CC
MKLYPASTFSVTLAFSLASSLATANTFNGKATGMSDAGIATTDYLQGLILNPAAPANLDDSQDFSLHLTLGAIGSDEDDLIDGAETLSQRLEQFDGQVPDMQRVAELAERFRAISGSHATVEAGGGLYMSVPTRMATISAFVRTDLAIDVVANTNENDLGRIAQVLATSIPLDTRDLESSVFATGTSLTEGGLSFARSNGDFSYGATVKYQRVDLIEYQARIDNFDDNNFDADEFRTDDNGFNLDLGVQQAFGNWRVGATVTNAIKADYATISGRQVSIEPRVALGGGYRNGWLTAALDLDANAAANRITGEDSQFGRIGIEFDMWDWAQLRLGYKTDMKSAIHDTASVGLGFSPFGVINVDIAAVAGDKDTVGAVLQLGLSF